MSLPFDEDEFVTWRENAITRFVFDTVLELGAKEAKQYWTKQAWEKGNLDPILHMECKSRVALADQLRTITYEDLVATNDAINSE